jgi:transcriptional regulator with XRE-family HTH domain
MSQEELTRFGRRLREARVARGMTQAELAGPKFSHAYISVLEAGRREPSRSALQYLAERLGVSVEELSGEKGARWSLELAADLRNTGLHEEGRNLLEKTLENLERDKELHPRVLLALHRELALIDADHRPESARSHLLRVLELASDDDSLIAQRGEASARLAELLLQEGDRDQALEHYRTSSTMLLELVSRSPALSAR